MRQSIEPVFKRNHKSTDVSSKHPRVHSVFSDLADVLAADVDEDLTFVLIKVLVVNEVSLFEGPLILKIEVVHI